MRVLIVNNYIEHRMRIAQLRRAIRDTARIEPNVIGFEGLTPSIAKEHDALILSGSGAMLNRPSDVHLFGEEAEVLKDFPGPLLGICFGHQLIGVAFGSTVSPLESKCTGYHSVERLTDDTIFRGLPKALTVLESHRQAVDGLMPGFFHLARSQTCELEAFRHERRPIYGVQFHPERYSDIHPHGRHVLENFVRMVVK